MRILITGAARAIGRATAEELVARGHEVVATARHPELLDDLSVAERLPLDVRDEASIAAALSACGELDAVVSNAAVTGAGPLEGFPLARIHDVFDTNTLGPLRLAQQVLGPWRERGSGVLVNVSSVQGRVVSPLEGPYSASKHALEALSEALYLEVGHFGIRVVLVEPGYVAPGMKDPGGHDGPPGVYDGLRAQWSGIDQKLSGPAGRTGPDVVGRAIADAVEDPATPLRVEVGDDAAMVLGLRRQLDDAAFEATMRQTLDFTW